MKTETKVLTPSDAGLTLAVLSGPRGSVRDETDSKGWPCIEYTCQLSNARRQIVWTGEYRLGVGHVKPIKYGTMGGMLSGMTADEENLSHHWAMGARFKDTPKNNQLQADTAAKLAKVQKVTPALNDVCHSLLSDGSAFFDGQRFEEWAGDLGYSSDSIKAKETFETCDRIGRDLARALSRDELTGLREWASSY